jgi:hypothetical protein
LVAGHSVGYGQTKNAEPFLTPPVFTSGVVPGSLERAFALAFATLSTATSVGHGSECDHLTLY